VNLRDARRLAARGWGPNEPDLARRLDALVARLGGRAKFSWALLEDGSPRREVGEARPKGTDEVSEATTRADGLHGGDGNAGEVDSPAQTAAAEPRREVSTSCSDLGMSQPAHASASTDGATAPRTEEARGGVDDRPSTRAMPHAPPPARGDASDDPRSVTEAVAGDSSPAAGQPTGDGRSDEGHEESELGTAEEDSSAEPEAIGRTPVASYGGDTAADWQQIMAAASRGDRRRAARDVESALRRVFAASDLGGTEPRPRLDGRRLVTELCARRYHLARALRRDAEIPLVVLAADVSGSCSAASTETLAAAVAIAKTISSTIVVRHSNGVVIDVVGQPARGLRVQDTDTLDGIVDRIGRPVACVIAWGDTDAADCYRRLCESSQVLIWLDSYAARSGAHPASAATRAIASGWRRTPAVWWQGVNSAGRTAIALRHAAHDLALSSHTRVRSPGRAPRRSR